MTEEEYKKGKIGLEQYYLDLSDDHFQMLLSLHSPTRWKEVDAQVATAIWLKQHDIGNKKPTKEQLIKVFQLFYSDKIVFTDTVSNEEAYNNIAEQVLNHWNDEDN